MYGNAPEYSGDPQRFSKRLVTWLAESGGELTLEHGLSILEHCVQTAEIARHEKAPENEIVTALLHDIGHILLQHQGPDGAAAANRHSEKVGAVWLSRYFPPAISEPVRLHQIAKRWLFAMDKGYRDSLSDEAFRILADMGGPMPETERRQFERNESWSAAVALARRDDMSCIPPQQPTSLTGYDIMVADCLSPQTVSNVA